MAGESPAGMMPGTYQAGLCTTPAAWNDSTVPNPQLITAARTRSSQAAAKNTTCPPSEWPISPIPSATSSCAISHDTHRATSCTCLLYTSDAADDLTRVDLG